ncbi:probable cytochrome P450 49a1 [Teleopsis dalmanni]|uniref:probable cytochrome P450 49a1 n=1 Tax=Teleopsis dalmanni TaxID=139649 RepID=UPI0018CD117B|nr:probable cytochrome P450 49a1 [Teleopsis dalmanni]
MSNVSKTTALVRRTTFSAAATTAFPTNAPPAISLNLEKISDSTRETKQNSTGAGKPYSEVPGPWGMPVIGNSWRFAPLIGPYKISDLDKVMKELHINYGKIAKVGGLIGHPDLLFVFDGDEIRNIFKKEEAMPHRLMLTVYGLMTIPDHDEG